MPWRYCYWICQLSCRPHLVASTHQRHVFRCLHCHCRMSTYYGLLKSVPCSSFLSLPEFSGPFSIIFPERNSSCDSILRGECQLRWQTFRAFLPQRAAPEGLDKFQSEAELVYEDLCIARKFACLAEHIGMEVWHNLSKICTLLQAWDIARSRRKCLELKDRSHALFFPKLAISWIPWVAEFVNRFCSQWSVPIPSLYNHQA